MRTGYKKRRQRTDVWQQLSRASFGTAPPQCVTVAPDPWSSSLHHRGDLVPGTAHRSCRIRQVQSSDQLRWAGADRVKNRLPESSCQKYPPANDWFCVILRPLSLLFNPFVSRSANTPATWADYFFHFHFGFGNF